MSSQTGKGDRVDALMEQASKALVARRYFEAERLAVSALRKAHTRRDYERMGRILLPLQEARRQKRDLAFDAAKSGAVFVVDAEVPSGRKLVPGCYLVAPPRVGLDGRQLREAADRREVPVIVTVREPTTRDGLWPVVALGPVTVRAKVTPPTSPGKKGKSGGPKAVASKGAKPSKAGAVTVGVDPPPTPEWFLEANEHLGDAGSALAIQSSPHARVDALMNALEAIPDHEKLHQRLMDAAREAQHAPVRRQAAGPVASAEDDQDADLE